MVMVCDPPNIISKTQATTKHVESLLFPYLDVGSTPTGSTNFASRRGAKKLRKILKFTCKNFDELFYLLQSSKRQSMW